MTRSAILAFDTALGGCGVAVLGTATGEVFSELRPMLRGQSEMLVPMVEEVMERAGLDYKDLELIVTTTGPGAFTGLRIGLSAARSYALALAIPIAGVTTMDVLATKFFKENKSLEDGLLAIVETKRNDLYFQHFQTDGEASDVPGVAAAEILLAEFGGRSLSLCGDGAERLRDSLAQDWPENWRLVPGYELPDPEILAAVGYARQKSGQSQPADPVYLRGADVSISTRPARKIAAVKDAEIY